MEKKKARYYRSHDGKYLGRRSINSENGVMDFSKIDSNNMEG